MNDFGNLEHKVYSNSYGQSKSQRLSIAIEGKLSAKEEDQILDSYPTLVTDDYRGWFIKRLRELGKTEFIGRADRAVKYGRDDGGQKLFVHLIR